jgi:NAD:arginine ADP-ribosyltransferase
LAIWIYTTPNDWHRRINEALWLGRPSSDILIFAEVLNGALRKLPVVARTVYRGWQSDSLDDFLRTFQAGRVLTWPGFVSTTRSPEKAYIGNVLFRIRSLTGRSLHGVGAEESEEEVLFQTGTRFMISAVSEASSGLVVVVDMTELEMGDFR